MLLTWDVVTWKNKTVQRETYPQAVDCFQPLNQSSQGRVENKHIRNHHLVDSCTGFNYLELTGQEEVSRDASKKT